MPVIFLFFFLQCLSVTLSTLSVSVSVSLRFNGHFPGEPGFIEAKDDGGGGDNWSYKSCEAPVKSSPPTNQHPNFPGEPGLAGVY